MNQNDIEKALVDPNYANYANDILRSSDAMELIVSKTKQVMWSVVEYKDLQMFYACAIKEVQTKLEILSTEFNVKHKRNPISSIHTRLKRTESIVKKLKKNHLPFTTESIEQNVCDFAGIRVICSYIDDIYSIAAALLKQDDIKLIQKKDYIEHPKPNGYRSLHLIVSVPVFFADTKREMKVEVQIRTIAMDFWASLEHQIKYKQEIPNQSDVCDELKACAEVIADTDQKMLKLRRQIELAEDAPTEEDILLERLRKLDIPLG